MSIKVSRIFAMVATALVIAAVTQSAQAVTSFYGSTSDSHHRQYNSGGQWSHESGSYNDNKEKNEKKKKNKIKENHKKKEKKENRKYFDKVSNRNDWNNYNYNITDDMTGYMAGYMADWFGRDDGKQKDEKKEYKSNDYRPLGNSYQGHPYRGKNGRYNRYKGNVGNGHPHHPSHNPIPEPITATLAMMSLSALGLGTRRRRSA